MFARSALRLPFNFLLIKGKVDFILAISYVYNFASFHLARGYYINYYANYVEQTGFYKVAEQILGHYR